MVIVAFCPWARVLCETVLGVLVVVGQLRRREGGRKGGRKGGRVGGEEVSRAKKDRGEERRRGGTDGGRKGEHTHERIFQWW